MIRHYMPLDKLCEIMPIITPSEEDWQNVIKKLQSFPEKAINWQEISSILGEILVRETIKKAASDIAQINLNVHYPKHYLWRLQKNPIESYEIVHKYETWRSPNGKIEPKKINEFDFLFEIEEEKTIPVAVEVKTGLRKNYRASKNGKKPKGMLTKMRNLEELMQSDTSAYLLIIPKGQSTPKELEGKEIKIVHFYKTQEKFKKNAIEALAEYAPIYLDKYEEYKSKKEEKLRSLLNPLIF